MNVGGRRLRAILTGALASAAGFAVLAAPLTAPASAQVMGSQPYVPQPDPAVERLTRRVDALENDVRAATNRNEQLTFDLGQARKTAEEAKAGLASANQTIASLTQRLELLERLVGPGATGAAAPGAEGGPVNLQGPAAGAPQAAAIDPAGLPQDEAGLLDAARNFLVEGQVAAAQQASNLFIERFPRSKSAGEAQYTIGEALMIAQDYPAAAQAYAKLLAAYPQSEQAPMGLVKLARAWRLMDKKADACKTLGLLPQRYPRASEMIKSLANTEKQRAGC